MSEQRRRVLADRYELESVLGQGGMARVFKGTDRVLNRPVAIKVLSPQFAGDKQFVARFRREAQAVAALNHPNIVSVYDTGSQGDVHYIVMEYVEGRTLRDVIKQEGPLLPQRASEIAEAVASALEAAHEAGITHSDIKPGNIMITRSNSEVKVMDFGIAKTTTGDTITQTASILGTASYLSPEQAQGERVDARSDIYSLGCVMYEMLTGRAPFSGDSPVTIAYKHVSENPEPPSRLNPDVSSSFEAIVLKSLAKNPVNRYQTAEELREDLERVRHGGAPMATPILADSTEMLTRAQRGPEQTAVMTGVPPDERPSRRRTWITAAVVILILAALGVAAFFLVKTLVPPEAKLNVPDVVGEKEEDARTTLEDLGFRVAVEKEFSEDERRDFVFAQDPEPDATAEEGDTVTITVSKGPRPVAVPDVVGESLETAGTLLGEAGFEIGNVTREESEEEEGTVLEQDPVAGAKVSPDTPVKLVVSGGPGTVTVPDVVCQDIDEAQGEISAAGLSFDVTGSEFSDSCPEGTVASQSPGGGTEVERGSTVRVVESKGPEPTETVTVEPTPTLPTP